MTFPRLALALRNVLVDYKQSTQHGQATLRVLDIPALDLRQGTHLAVTGPSGCGKTTFLHMLAGLERPTSGDVNWMSQSLYGMSEAARDRWRARNVGIVFQEPSLFHELTALENVLVPIWVQNLWVETRLKYHARHLLLRVGVRPETMGFALSRGEAQRVGLVRAVIRQPPTLLADEPTASLDAANGLAVRDLLLELAREYGATLIVTTHDENVASVMVQRYEICDARLDAVIVHETARPEPDESVSHP
jgi:putative ABC transport system ATP-binding protein